MMARLMLGLGELLGSMVPCPSSTRGAACVAIIVPLSCSRAWVARSDSQDIHDFQTYRIPLPISAKPHSGLALPLLILNSSTFRLSSSNPLTRSFASSFFFSLTWKR
jgi:hypothetical protein